MRRFANCLTLMGAALLVCGAAAVFPKPAMAFETESGAVTVPGGTTQFGDPDETRMPPPLPSARLDEDGSTPDTSSGFSFQMAPTGQSNDNPADNKALIPVP